MNLSDLPKLRAAHARPTVAKYRNKRIVIDGWQYDSLAESRYGEQLRTLERGGAIQGLKLHPKYELDVNDARLCTYVADFEYFTEHGRCVVDVKGCLTAVCRIKLRLMKSLLGIEVQLITKKTNPSIFRTERRAA